ncbi:GumK N-terminal domain-containing glycosyltransferase [Microvirga pudoricolor]|uniref:GumK N-terminal domain-containing glycosyltransferase n=1 Tax=Microvirga pudoricolor TaxID=2778729 RepID=UPI0019522951|nr:glycosyltransferase [Microvirga pudoricolor]MBM6593253.1 glycosyltransferase [Microvirga pudoricolor]
MSGRPVAVLFTQQFVGLNTRKTGMVFWAETLAKRGFDTYAVTVQLSLLSKLAGSPRLKRVPEGDLNTWRPRGENLSGFVWVAPVHPASFKNKLLDRAAAAVYSLYPYFLPAAVRDVVSRADLVVIESCSAVLLFDRLRAIAPKHARFVYCASDRLGTVGMHPMLAATLERTAPRYDLLRVPAQAMLGDFPKGSQVSFIPHGIDKEAFSGKGESPFDGPGPHVVVAGEMLFDHHAVSVLLDAFPEVTFHAFGHLKLDGLETRPNLRAYGEVAFATLVNYLHHADVGLAPYLDRAEAHYLAESSLKLIQYTYCQLPVVAPHFAKAGRAHVIGYDPAAPESIKAALRTALTYDRSSIDRSRVSSWDEVISRLLESVGPGSRPAEAPAGPLAAAAV